MSKSVKFLVTILGVMVGLLLLTGVSLFVSCTGMDGGQKSEKIGLAPGEAMPVFSIEDINGNKVTEKYFSKNLITVLNVWSTSCGPCVEELPELQALSQKYEKEKVGVVTLLADGKDNQPQAADILCEENLSIPVWIPDEKLCKEFVDREQVVPYTVIIDGKGQITNITMGAMTRKELEQVVEKALKR